MATRALPARVDDGAASFEGALGELLVERGKLDPAGLARALRLAEGSEERLHGLLVKLGLVPERDVAEALAQLLQLPLAGPADFPDLPVQGEPVSANFLKQAHILPLAETEDGLVVAMADPLDHYTIMSQSFATTQWYRPRPTTSVT